MSLTQTPNPLKALIVVGTRPELVKLAPVIHTLKRRDSQFTPRVLFTAQHRGLLDQMASFFNVQADIDLDTMRPDQTLAGLTARLIESLDPVFAREQPDVVVVQGDTTTVFAASLVSYYRRIPLAHVEAGLRSHDLYSPYPEEANRKLTGSLATFHFAPTPRAAENLRREGLDPRNIHVTGNTVVDALRSVDASRLALPLPLGAGRPLVLVTVHRRESFGDGVRQIFSAIRQLATERPGVDFVFPMHPNPHSQGVALDMLSGLPNVKLIQALDYGGFMALMRRATLLLSDSGGVQEEAPSLGVPLLVLRDVTERPEVLECGAAKLVGTNRDLILSRARTLLDSETARAAMRPAVNPFGDGRAAERIADVLARDLQPKAATN
jgi:UDP-N-acetylglucosamine 2-epimerase (non-hydrolysing)